MKTSRHIFFFLFVLINTLPLYAQDFVTKDIKFFGAKGDGKTNDQSAFKKASDFFNARGGNGKLTISAGTYIIGKQTFTGGQPGKPVYETDNVLFLTGVKNFIIQGTSKSIIKYRDGLRYGTFDKTTGEIYEHGNGNFTNGSLTASLLYAIYFEKSNNVNITDLTLDGNSGKVILGGTFGDVGRQLAPYGIFIMNCF